MTDFLILAAAVGWLAFVFEFIRANGNEDKVRDLRTSNALLARRLREHAARPTSPTPIHDALVIDLFRVAAGLDEQSEEWHT